MRKRIKKQFGFTYMELLVSMLIIAIMSTMLMANYHSTNENAKLNISAQKLVNDIRLAQSNSLALKEYDGSFPSGGWGVYFDKNELKYIVFADLNGDHSYTANEGQENKGARIVEFTDGVSINSISVVGDELIVTFLPPDPVVYVNGHDNIDAQISITDGRLTESININFLGLIEIQ